jgi:ATP-dependent exoDNAse (exonuclease V) beta subunit
MLEAAGSAAAGIAQYSDWKQARRRDLDKGQAKHFDIVTATGITDPPPAAAPVIVESVAQAAGRPRGVRFGALLHAVLRDIDLAAGRDHAERLAEMHGKLLDASEAEVASAVDAAVGALSHPLLGRARAAARCHREIPVLLPLSQGRTLEGVIDLAFLENGAWIVVDFKSDAELSASLSGYERQAQWYAYALTRLTGLPATAVLLRA